MRWHRCESQADTDECSNYREIHPGSLPSHLVDNWKEAIAIWSELLALTPRTAAAVVETNRLCSDGWLEGQFFGLHYAVGDSLPAGLSLDIVIQETDKALATAAPCLYKLVGDIPITVGVSRVGTQFIDHVKDRPARVIRNIGLHEIGHVLGGAAYPGKKVPLSDR